MYSSRLACALAFCFLILSGGRAVAQTSLEALTEVREVLDLGAESAETNPRAVSVRGIVVFVGRNRDGFSLHQQGSTIAVNLPADATLPCPELGDEVEVQGVTVKGLVMQHAYPRINASAVRHIGRQDLPTAPQVPLASVAEFEHYDQWVSIEGVVIAWAYENEELTIVLVGPKNWANVHVRGLTADQVPEDWHGARLHVSGSNMGWSHSPSDALMVPSMALVQVLAPGSADPFAAPTHRSGQAFPLAQRVLVRGQLIGRTADSVLYLRDETSALCVKLQYPWNRGTFSKEAVLADGGFWPEMQIGDLIEVVGSRWETETDPNLEPFSLQECHVRVVGSQGPPQPISATLAEVAKGNFTHDYVEVRGRLITLQQAPMDRGEWRTTMVIEDNGVQMPVAHQGRGRAGFASLHLDDEVLVRALVGGATRLDPRHLKLLAEHDANSMGPSPAMRMRKLLLWGGGGAVCVAALALWIGLLRRALNRQKKADAALREINTTLEQRVAERTAALETAQADLSRALEHERELGELKSRFVTMVSHEFRTPLGIIMSAIELMRHYEGKLEPGQREELYEDIHSSTKLMGSLMEQVLVLGRVEAGKLGCRPMPLDVDVLAGKLTDELLSATNRRCPVEWEMEGSLEGAWADESLLRHTFSNLISNAIKYSPEGSPVRFTGRREGNDAVFQVIDQGIGIPAEEIPNLFEAFHRCANVGDTPGTGMGLLIAKRCVALHGGTLELESVLGVGTTFTLRLPLFRDSP
ncbi:MAG: HAMP domain-containing histidine kinase [Verrucomicrobiales bacterium]|nr:HAMP domain-containing histidine kinase [Verrucomicrobiales bacterium]